MATKVAENQAGPEHYQNFPVKRLNWYIIIVVTFIFGLFGHLSVGTWIESKLNQTMASIPGCQLSYSEFSFLWFPLPSVQLLSPTFQGKCSPNPQRPLQLSQLGIQFRGPGLWPFGAKFKLSASLGKSQLDLFVTTTLKSQTVAISDSTLNLQDLASLAPFPVSLKGGAMVNALYEIQDQKLQSGSLRLDFRSLEIPAQTIKAFALPQLALDKGQLKLTQTPSEIIIETMELGSLDAPLRAEFKGKIKWNSLMPEMSPLDLKGKVRFSPQLLQEFGMMINLFTAGLKQENGFYSMKLGGTLSFPRAMPL